MSNVNMKISRIYFLLRYHRNCRKSYLTTVTEHPESFSQRGGGGFRGQRGVDSSRKGPDPLTPTLDPRMGAHRKQVELYTL